MEKGIAATSMDDIAKASGYSKATLYVYFENKEEIAVLLQKCQLVILASPVYWANVPAPAKNLFDRLLGTAMEETAAFLKPRLQGKQYMILTSCNTPAPFSWIFGQSRGAIRNMDEFFKTAGMKSTGKVVCANAKHKKELSKRTIEKIKRCLK